MFWLKKSREPTQFAVFFSEPTLKMLRSQGSCAPRILAVMRPSRRSRVRLGRPSLLGETRAVRFFFLVGGGGGRIFLIPTVGDCFVFSHCINITSFSFFVLWPTGFDANHFERSLTWISSEMTQEWWKNHTSDVCHSLAEQLSNLAIPFPMERYWYRAYV